jgi:hypothetical protein
MYNRYKKEPALGLPTTTCLGYINAAIPTGRRSAAREDEMTAAELDPA